MDSYRIFFSTIGSPSDEIPIWEFYVDNVEVVAGILAASVGIIEDLNAGIGTLTNLGTSYYNVDSDVDVSKYRVLSDIPEENIRLDSIIPAGYYGIWLKGSKRFHYSLYIFRTNTFFQGIITICSTFEVDFRNYIYGFPFDKYGTQYALSGYIMAQYQYAIDAPDIDDIEQEEEDNETINEPLARTDDMIL